MCADMFWMKSWAIKAVCKSSGYKTVEQRLGWRASVFITVTLRYFFFLVFLCFLEETSPASWHQCARKDETKLGLLVNSTNASSVFPLS